MLNDHSQKNEELMFRALETVRVVLRITLEMSVCIRCSGKDNFRDATHGLNNHHGTNRYRHHHHHCFHHHHHGNSRHHHHHHHHGNSRHHHHHHHGNSRHHRHHRHHHHGNSRRHHHHHHEFTYHYHMPSHRSIDVELSDKSLTWFSCYSSASFFLNTSFELSVTV